MRPTQFALYGGIVMLVLGVLALFMPLSGYPPFTPDLVVTDSYGMFLGIFAMNILNKLALIAFGIAGILVSRSQTRALPLSIGYARVVCVVMGLAAILGLIPSTNTLGGYWPLFGANVLEHGIFALFGGYFGYMLTKRAGDANREQFGELREVDRPPRARAS